MNVDDKVWHEIGDKLTKYLNICSCQRKIKSIVTVLLNIYNKIELGHFDFTPEEYLIVALLDAKGYITHGINIEYPMIVSVTEDSFWLWLQEIKDNPNLVDN